MKVLFSTPVPEFAKEVGDVISLFFGKAVYRVNQPPEGEDLVVEHSESLEGDIRRCFVTLHGRFDGSAELEEKIQTDPLIEKRLHKRQVKRCVYLVLLQATKQSPPWGSLTGIRPTRLVYDELQHGATLPVALANVQQTFDVSDHKIELLKDIITVQQSLPVPTAKDTDVYVGIPFCVSRCYYCSFLSAEVGKGEWLAPYVDALLLEIESTIKLIQRKGLNVRAFYMGGGTPTALPLPLFRKVLHAAQPLIDLATEATIEAGRPDTLDKDKLLAIHDVGASRISINPQTMHDETLAMIGRNHTRKQTEYAYKLARDIGFKHINMDIIAGLPKEDEEHFAKTLTWSETLKPESLTIHTLSVKRSSVLHLKQDSLPRGELVSTMVDMGRAHAYKQGMQPYYLYRQKHQAGNLENVGYAQPGHACLYNIDTMEDICSVLAVGAGSITKRVWPGREKIVRAPNVKEIEHYINRVDEMVQRKIILWDEG